MFIKQNSRRVAFSLLEMLVAVGIFSVVGASVGTAYLFGLRSFQGLSNYAKLDKQNRQAMDLITKEIREAYGVLDFKNGSSAYITILDGNTNTIKYSFNNSAQTMSRYTNGTLDKVLLQNCSLVKFHLGMRPGKTNTWGYYQTTNVNDAKVVDLTWKTGIQLRTGLTNSENIQTAQIVIRKQKLSQ